MSENRIYHRRTGTRRAFALLLFLTLLIYSNTFRASWHLDDYQNIVYNNRVHIEELSPHSLSRVIRPPLYDRIWRPVSFLTFAGNWYFGSDNVFGYHLVNIFIHALTSWIIFLTVVRIFRTPVLRNKYGDAGYLIALMSAVLWSVNPIHTQAVTYIVQRMTLLATFFYALSLLCYIQARLIDSGSRKRAFIVGCCLSFLIGVGCKEIAATLPIALILVEAAFFRDLANPKVRKKIIVLLTAGVIGILLLGTLFFLRGDLLSVLNGYRSVDYLPLQRLMTQFRALILYISQIFYPASARLSFEHDIDISTSLLTPWTTLPAILVVSGLAVFGLIQLRKRPVLGFSITFFFLNHIIESTIIPLELVFEHRNYLPSLFIFMPVATGFKWALAYYRKKKRPLYVATAGFLTLLIFCFGTATYMRNYAWQTEKSLWTDASRKAPAMSRPVASLAWAYYEGNGHYEQALLLYKKALHLKTHRKFHRASINNNIANMYYLLGDYKAAEVFWQRAIEINPNIAQYQYRLAVVLNRQRQWERALLCLNQIIAKHPDQFNYLNLKGIILLHQKKPRRALACFKKCIKLSPEQPKGYIHAGVTLDIIGAEDRAELLLKHAHSLKPNNITTKIRLIDINLKTGDSGEVNRYLNKLLSSATISDIINSLNQLSGEPFVQTDRITALAGRINTELEKQTDTVSTPGTGQKGS